MPTPWVESQYLGSLSRPKVIQLPKIRGRCGATQPGCQLDLPSLVLVPRVAETWASAGLRALVDKRRDLSGRSRTGTRYGTASWVVRR